MPDNILEPIAPPRGYGKLGKATCAQFEVVLPCGTKDGQPVFRPAILSVGWDRTGQLHEMRIEGMSKTGHALDQMMDELMRMVSRILQDRHPATGKPIWPNTEETP